MLLFLAQFDISVDGFPGWLKTLVWISVGLAAASVIWDKIHGRQIAQIILKELTINGGSSMKDEVTKGMVDSREALRISKEIQVLQKIQHSDLDGRMAEVEGGIKGLLFRVDSIEKEFARFVRHAAANDLQRSRLLQESEALLAEDAGKGNGAV